MSREAMQKALDALCDFDYDKRMEAIAALRAALCETPQPVAWILAASVPVDTFGARVYPKQFGETTIPLYTHPARTLTDEEIREALREYVRFILVDAVEVARAVLRKAGAE